MTSTPPGAASGTPEPAPAPTAVPGADPAGAPVARDVDALADPVAAAVLACPGVAALSGGPFGTVATLLPGRRVAGVSITETQATIHLVVGYPAPVTDVAARVRSAVTALVPGLPVHVGVDDVTDAPPA